MQEGYVLAKVVKPADYGKQWTIIPIKCVLGKAVINDEEICRRKLTKVIKLDISEKDTDSLVAIWETKNDLLTNLNKEIAELKKQYHAKVKEIGGSDVYN